MGESRTFRGPEAYLRERGDGQPVADDERCVRLMRDVIAARPELRDEDIGA